jgi:hypothetical protein
MVLKSLRDRIRSFGFQFRASVISRLDRLIHSPLRAHYLFDYEWDLAIVLDACRYDLAAEQCLKHSVELRNPTRVYSAGSDSSEWIKRTFSRASADQLSQTAYITANAFSALLAEKKLALLDEVWRYASDSELGAVRPNVITDRTITAMREGVADRYVAHYLPPHLPPIDDDGYEFYELHRKEQDPWAMVAQGAVPSKPFVRAYAQNLTPVLDEIELLLDNVNASKVVVTADHGQYLGERGCWGHPPGHTHPAVRHVPWFETIATDHGTYTPDEYDQTQTTADREAVLRALGYIDH